MKFKQSEINKLITEELERSRKELVAEILGSTSRLEIEELLRVYFKEAGGVPQDISRLSVLFPILERAGLSDIVDAYIEKAKGANKQEAYQILEPVRDALIKIKGEKRQ